MKWLVCLLVCMVILPVIGHAEATEITKECQLVFAPRSEGKKNMSDASYITFYKGKYLEVVTPEDAPCYGLYISFAGREAPYQVQQMNRQGEWETVLQDSRLYANSYLPLPGLSCFRIAPDGGEDISIAEIHLFGEGEKPGWVQDWGRYANNIFGLCYSAVGTDEAMNDLFENLPEQ